jgi:PAS domain S-box-containing protein
MAGENAQGCQASAQPMQQTTVQSEKSKRAAPRRAQPKPLERPEEVLLRAGALQAAVLKTVSFASIATDEGGVIQIFNVGAERMFGYEAADVLNRTTPADISDPASVIARAAELSQEFETAISPGFDALVFKANRGIEDIYDLTCVRKDASRFPAVVSVTALCGDDDEIIGYLLIVTDNTLRKQVEDEKEKIGQRLRDQQFYTRSLVESNTDALMATDSNGIISDVNRQMETLTGCTRDQLIGAPFKSCFTDSDRAHAAIKQVLCKNKLADYELTVRTRMGEETIVSCNATTFHNGEQLLQGVFVSARDVTDRKRFEHELQKSNVELKGAKFAAERANLAKSDFLSSMSHELRSPLGAILGFAQLMESSTPEPTPIQASRIAQILQAGWHLLKLIDEILDLAVIESGQISLMIESVSLAQVLEECQTMMEPQAEQRGITMTFPKLEAAVRVKADRTRLKQVVINLISNAIKYNKPKGSVDIGCIVVEKGRIRLSVRDSGDGIAAEMVAQLFQPFNRLGQAGGAVAGTGIGLVVTKRLTELMDGDLGVESTEGVGSTFWCELPGAESADAEKNGSAKPFFRPPPSSVGPQRKLLYVEDNAANMEVVAQIVMRRPDIQLLTAVNGARGLEIARAEIPTVILLDLNLPGISGMTVMKSLQTDALTAHIPVVALTANAMASDREKGLNAGFFRYITKPIKVADFLDTLTAALEFSDCKRG